MAFGRAEFRMYKDFVDNQAIAAEGYVNTESNQRSTQFSSQDAMVSTTIYPALLAILVSAPLSWEMVSLGFVL